MRRKSVKTLFASIPVLLAVFIGYRYATPKAAGVSGSGIACQVGGEAKPPHVSVSTNVQPATLVANEKPPRYTAATRGMQWPGGEFSMGSDDTKFTDARPWHRVYVDGFWIDTSEVTNTLFAKFVHATGYVTVAELKPDPKEYPAAPPENLVAGSLVFTPPKDALSFGNPYQGWNYVPEANWRHPEGRGINLNGRDEHPVVPVAYDDAVAYCSWDGGRLPTEAEFEFAARGGLDHKRYAWGDDFKPNGRFMANTFQGHFPDHNSAQDGYASTAPVASFPAHGYGLHDMAGNVWEWTSDWYRPDYYQTLTSADTVARNPQGPADSLDPDEPGIAKRVQRGGSFLCTEQYCTRYEVGARGKGSPDTGTNHLGFRCVRDDKTPAQPTVTSGLPISLS